MTSFVATPDEQGSIETFEGVCLDGIGGRIHVTPVRVVFDGSGGADKGGLVEMAIRNISSMCCLGPRMLQIVSGSGRTLVSTRSGDAQRLQEAIVGQYAAQKSASECHPTSEARGREVCGDSAVPTGRGFGGA